MEEMASLSDKHIQKIIEYLSAQGWSMGQIMDFIKFITA